MNVGRADIEARIAALEDRADIAELRARYCHVLDDRNWEALADLFTKDGEFDGLARVKGRENILSFFRDTVSGIAEDFWHFCTNPTLSLDGNRAHGRIAMQYLSVKGGVSYNSAGHYDDLFARENGVWKFARRKITFYYFAPVSEGFTGQPTYIHPDGRPRDWQGEP
jgi:hypothetical protein